MTKRTPNGPPSEQINLLDRTIDSTITITRPYVLLARGAIKGAIAGGHKGWKQAIDYRAMELEIALMNAEDFCDTPDNTQ